MNEQVYGVFNNLENAERALSALKDHGVGGNELSVVRRSDGAGLPQVENLADGAITPTSAGDVVAGALKGGAAGLAVGILAGAAMLTIPGVGPILAAGPIAAALGASAIATAAGATVGGVVGYLVDQGVPEQAATRYSTAVDRGDILVAVRSPSISTTDAMLMLRKYGATEIESHIVGSPSRLGEPPIVDEEADLEQKVARTI
jgi:hypothetical protein